MQIKIGSVKELWRYPVKSMEGEQILKAQIDTLGVVGDRCWITRDETTREIQTVRKLPKLLHCTAQFLDEPQPGQTGADIPHVQVQLPDGTRFNTSEERASQLLSDYLKKDVSLQPLRPKSDKAFYSLKTLNGEQAMKQQFAARGGMPSLGSISWSRMIELGSYVTPRGRFYDVYPLHILTSNSIEAMRQLEPAGDFQSRRFRPSIYIECTQKNARLEEFDWLGGTLYIGDTVIKCESRTVRCSMPAQPQRGLEKDGKVLRALDKHTQRHLGINASVKQPGTIRDGDAVYYKPASRLSLRRFTQPAGERIRNALIQRSLKAIDKKRA